MPIASPFCRSLSDSFVKSRPSVACPVASTWYPSCPLVASTTSTIGAIFVSALSISSPGMVTGISVLC